MTISPDKISESILDHLPGVFYLFSADGRLLRWNRNLERVTGYSAEELKDRPPWDFFQGQDRALIEQQFRQVLRDGHVAPEANLVAKNGQVIPYYFTGARLDWQGRPFVVGLGIDIADRRAFTETLRQRVTLSRGLLDGITESLFLVDTNGVIQTANAIAARRFQRNPDEVAGLSIYELFPDEVRNSRQACIEQAINTGEFVLQEDTRNGRVFHTRYEPVRDNGDHVIGVCIFAQDITDRKEAETQIRRLNRELADRVAELEAKNEELERFTYTVSHDLKAPLITVKGYLGLCEADLNLGDTQAVVEDLQRIHGAADRMERLLRELLELSRIGRVVQPSTNVSVRDIIDEAVALCAGLIRQSNAQLEVDPDLPMLYVDRYRFVEVFQNLISNAVKFMGSQQHPRVEIGMTKRNSEQLLFVRDNGIGIDPELQHKVFGLFQQLNPHIEGTGIGLAIARRIVELHEGRIWVESKGPGQGTCFYIALPDAAFAQ